MSIGNTDFVKSPLNYRWDPEVFMFRFALFDVFCAPRIKRSQSLWIPFSEMGGLHKDPAPRDLIVYTVSIMWKSKCYGSRKCLCSEKKTIQLNSCCNAGSLFCGKSVPNTAHQGCNSQEMTVILLDGRKFQMNLFWFSMAKCKVQWKFKSSYHITQLWVGFTVLNLCNCVWRVRHHSEQPTLSVYPAARWLEPQLLKWFD